VRKVRNRGFTPVVYHCAAGFVSGWIYKRDRKWLRFYSPSLGSKKLPIAAERNMRPVQ
jgi:hypothetical protein